MYPIFSYVYLIKYIQFKKSDWMCRIVRTSTYQRRSQGRKIALNDRTTGRRKMSIFCFVTKTGSEIFCVELVPEITRVGIQQFI